MAIFYGHCYTHGPRATLMDEVRDQPKQYVITKHGRPVAKLVPPDAETVSPFGYLRALVVHQDDIVSPDFEAWGELG